LNPARFAAGETEPEEHDLVLLARAGNRDAFGALVTRHMHRAYYVALGLVGSHQDAQDLSQEAFARVLRHHESLDPGKQFFGLVYHVLRRLCFNHLRDSKSRSRQLAERTEWLAEEARSRESGAGPEALAERNELRKRLAEAIAALSDKEREVLVLKEFDGLKYREISDLLGIPAGTVMSRLYAARRALAKALEANR
jgi:RNA polymerase sigma-70 factor (ECF subfamily)